MTIGRRCLVRAAWASLALAALAAAPAYGDVFLGTPGDNVLHGTDVADVIRARGGDDRLFGAAEADVLHGDLGDDRLNGGRGHDELHGGPGDDTLVGGFGRDRLFGGFGADRVFASDWRRDAIDCGPGRDLVIADGFDRIADDCEVVRGNEESVAPATVLSSRAGRQHGVQGSYCVSYPVDERDTGRVTQCVDAVPDLHPNRLSVVRPREVVMIAVREATMVTGGAAVFRLGCDDRAIRRFSLAERTTRWRVRLTPGAYEIDVFVRFETADGRSGDTSGLVGLVVSRTRERRIIPAPDSPGCGR